MAQRFVTVQGQKDPIAVGKIVCIGRNYVAHIEANMAATKDPAILDRLAKAVYDRLP